MSNEFIPVVWTDAGLSASINADKGGYQLEITHVSAGTKSYTPSPGQTALVDEVQKVPVGGGQDLTATQIQLSALFDGDLQYEVYEVGFWSGEVLVAVHSVPGVRLNYKSATNNWAEIFTLDLSPLPAGSVTFEVGVNNANLFITNELAKLATANINNMTRHLQMYFTLHKKNLI